MDVPKETDLPVQTGHPLSTPLGPRYPSSVTTEKVPGLPQFTGLCFSHSEGVGVRSVCPLGPSVSLRQTRLRDRPSLEDPVAEGCGGPGDVEECVYLLWTH